MTADLSAPHVALATSAADDSVLEELLRLEAAGFEPGERWSAASWRSELSDDSFSVLLARAGDEVIGVVALRVAAEVCELDRIVVDPGWRRQQLGRRLLEAGLRTAADAGAAEMILEVRSDNTAAIALYRGCGFRTLTVRRDYYGPGRNATIMKLIWGGGR